MYDAKNYKEEYEYEVNRNGYVYMGTVTPEETYWFDDGDRIYTYYMDDSCTAEDIAEMLEWDDIADSEQTKGMDKRDLFEHYCDAVTKYVQNDKGFCEWCIDKFMEEMKDDPRY